MLLLLINVCFKRIFRFFLGNRRQFFYRLMFLGDGWSAMIFNEPGSDWYYRLSNSLTLLKNYCLDCACFIDCRNDYTNSYF